ncbi:hypothetical protein C5167_046315 [Papaver somniferum]|uniref:THO1-MOS11 C-terminal domain-containing protein n=1 Tax=Papaver somniferum TaxID=3469 RepID=A0A4Y7LH42_PAPSO|nr:protein MODIFIER OF SNC1 11-like [Papaver somniferum]XP_026426966.1 protein MODIFIER OF SNC1 11-like [Papaver somniferum]RZC83529.1 hypothetical protein C5167_046315 [Papaver somniferum]
MATEIQELKEIEIPQGKTLETISQEPVNKEDEGTKESKSETNLDSTVADADLQKKMRRAERFGVPVNLSEKDKRNTRAERFGTAPTVQESDASKNSEDLKRKARAERFGLPAKPVADATDEEAKKKARQDRFTSNSKTSPKMDSVEEDKMKARAIRFSQCPASAPSQTTNGKGISIEGTADVKASGGT